MRKLIGVLMGVGAASSAAAQTAITIDSSFGRTPGQIGPSATNTTVTGNRGATYNVNNLYTIAESQGRTAGANLFHSFGTFNVGTGDAAVFTTTTTTLQNIIARVSGPSASTIQGLLAVNAATGSNPNLFLINPAGVTFGSGAVVDVPAAFHVSTANELRFADGTTFKAGVGPDSSMTMAAPEAFGFVGGSANIAFNGVQANAQQGGATFSAGSFDVTAGGVTFDGSSISAPQAQVRLLANGGTSNSIPIDGMPATLQGDVRLTSSSIDTNPVNIGPAGDIVLLGRNVLLDDAVLMASIRADDARSGVTVPPVRSGNISLRSLGGGDIVARNSTITSQGRGMGAADGIRVETTGDVLLLDSAVTSTGVGTATGDISIRADEIVLDGTSTVSVNLLDGPTLTNGGVGSITLDASNRVAIGTGASIEARSRGGFANFDELSTRGTIRLNTPRLELAGTISAESNSSFNLDGTVRSGGGIDANDIVLDGGSAGLIIAGTGLVTSSNPGSFATPGKITVLGRDITISGIRVRSQSAADLGVGNGSDLGGGAGFIQLAADDRISLSGVQFQTDIERPGTGMRSGAGGIDLKARAISIDSSQLTSRAPAGSAGTAGAIFVRGEDSLSITNSTLSVANDATMANPAGFMRGQINLSAPEITLENAALTAESSQNVDAASIQVAAVGNETSLTIKNSSISSSARGTAAGGNISLISSGLGLLSLIDSSVTSEARGASAGDLSLGATQLFLKGASRVSTSLLGGPAMTTGGVGAIRLSSGDLVIDAGSSVEARAIGSFDNPEQATPNKILLLTTGSLDISGTITTETLGNVRASDIEINTIGSLDIVGSGLVTSSTSGSGNAGNIAIIGSNEGLSATFPVDVSLSGITITSASMSGSSGSAGAVSIDASGNLTLAQTIIRSDTAGTGKAGNITFSAPTISVDGSLISSQAASDSSGQTGTIDIAATNTLELRDSTVSIANAARVADPSMTPLGRIRLSASAAKLVDTNVTAQSSENVTASAIAVSAPNGLVVRNSNVTTSAQDGNGGNIDVLAQRYLVLDRSQISTSVFGTQSGSGGNIGVRANVGVINNGFIQANTAAPGASGGNVVIDVGQLLPIGRLVSGGSLPLSFDPQNGFNAIQAAAPDGVSGAIQLTGPALDIVGTLPRVEAEFVATTPLGQDLCKQGNGSSLTQLGRGGLRPLSTGLLRPDTSLALLPELPALSLRLSSELPFSDNCEVGRVSR